MPAVQRVSMITAAALFASLVIEGLLVAIAVGGLLVRVHRPSPVPLAERSRVLAA